MAQVKLPKAVQQQEDRANELLKEAEGELKKTVVEPPNPLGDLAQPPKKAEQEQPKVDDASQALAPKPKEEDPFKHRYEALKGKYDQEVPGLHRELREAKATVDALQKQIDELRQAVEARPDPQPKPQEPAVSSIDFDYLEREFPPEVIQAMRAQHSQIETLKQQLSQTLQEVENVKGNVDTVTTSFANTKEAEFWEELEEKHPDWNTKYNGDENFLRWLMEKEPLSRMTYQDLLTNAQQDLDAKGVIAIIDRWVDVSKPQGAVTSPLAEPAIGGSDIGGTDVKQTYTRAQIKQFYQDQRAGKLPYDADTQRFYEEDFIRADREGRIVG